MNKGTKEIREHYSSIKNVEKRIELATTGETGKLITHRFRKIVSLLAPYNKGEKIADIGCGFGYLLKFLPDDIEVYAVDITPAQIRNAKRFRKNFIGVVGDAHELPFEDNTFDKLFSINLTPHLYDIDKALREFYRVLKPNGLAVVNFMNKYSPTVMPFSIFKLKLGYYFEHGIMTPSKQHSFSYIKARELTKKAGFKVLNMYGGGISFPRKLSQKVPWFASKWTDFTIRTEDLPIFKLLTETIILKLQK